MLTDWIHWISSLPRDRFWLPLVPLLLLDAPRYALGCVGMFVADIARSLWRRFRRAPQTARYTIQPSVSVVIAGFNESTTIQETLNTVWGSYPDLQIIVVDDGSTDETSSVVRAFAHEHQHVLLLRRPQRGGKSSALNFALPYVTADVIVCVDADSHLGSRAIWEIVQPFRDPHVGAVSGSVLARRPFVNLLTCLQAFEYLRCIFLGREVASRLGVLSIVSGAFGAYRCSALRRVMGWDVGPGEDGDLTLRLRKAGFKIKFAPYAECYTELPSSLSQLFKQRRRWEWATVTFECRKHIDMANVASPNFRWSNLVILLDRWLFNLITVYILWAYFFWLTCHYNEDTWRLCLLYYVSYVLIEFVQLCVLLHYSPHPRRDLAVGLVLPLSPFYHLFLKAVSLLAITEELFLRRSYHDDFVPAHVRQVTWHW